MHNLLFAAFPIHELNRRILTFFLRRGGEGGSQVE